MKSISEMTNQELITNVVDNFGYDNYVMPMNRKESDLQKEIADQYQLGFDANQCIANDFRVDKAWAAL